MANVPTIGVFLPSALNACNYPGNTGQQDVYGNNYPSGLNPGKVIELGDNEAQGLALPGTTLYGGAYSWVKLDAAAVSANALVGAPAYLIPSTYGVPTVTDGVTAGAGAIAVGLFINPSAFAVTPGNWCFIFIGAGRAAATYKAPPTKTPVIGDSVDVVVSTATVDDTSATVVTAQTIGRTFTAPSPLANPAGTPTGTPATTGGTMGAGNTYARIVAINATGNTLPGTESAAVATTGTTASIAWAWTAVTGAASYQIWVGSAAGGEANYFTSATNSFTQIAPSATGTAGTLPTANTTLNGVIYIKDILYRIPN